MPTPSKRTHVASQTSSGLPVHSYTRPIYIHVFDSMARRNCCCVNDRISSDFVPAVVVANVVGAGVARDAFVGAAAFQDTDGTRPTRPCAASVGRGKGRCSHSARAKNTHGRRTRLLQPLVVDSRAGVSPGKVFNCTRSRTMEIIPEMSRKNHSNNDTRGGKKRPSTGGEDNNPTADKQLPMSTKPELEQHGFHPRVCP